MSEDRLPTDFMITAVTRTASREGVPITVLRHGDNSSGTILLKINLLNGTARVLTQTRIDDELVWNPVSRTDPMNELDADSYIEKQTKIDPDSWILEIEDRKGRHWFPGKVVSF